MSRKQQLLDLALAYEARANAYRQMVGKDTHTFSDDVARVARRMARELGE